MASRFASAYSWILWERSDGGSGDEEKATPRPLWSHPLRSKPDK